MESIPNHAAPVKNLLLMLSIKAITAITCMAGTLLVGNRDNAGDADGILKFDLATGNYLGYFGDATFAASGLDRVVDVEADSQGNVYASSTTGYSVVKFDAAGNYQGVFGDASSADIPNFIPLSIAIDSSDNVYVSARVSSDYRIYKFNSSGTLQGAIVTGLSAGYSGGAGSLFIDHSNVLYYVEGGSTYSDTTDDKIKRFSTGGTSLGTIVNLSPSGANGRGYGFVDSLGNLFYRSDDEIYQYNSSGVFQGKLDETDTNFSGVGVWHIGIIGDLSGRLFVQSSGNRNVIYFDASGQFQGIFGQTNATGLGNSFFPAGLAIIGDSPPTYTVTFSEGAHGSRTGGGALVQTVISGGAATAPVMTPDFGWEFTGWNKSFNNVTQNLSVTALYATAEHAVTFDLGGHAVRIGGGALSQTVLHGQAAVEPMISVNSGWVFSAWDADFDSITDDLTVNAVFGTTLSNSGPADNAIVTSDRTPPSGGNPSTVDVGSLTLNEGIAFELGPNETLQLNSGPLTIESGASFTANGIILGDVINAGLLRIPILNLPDLTNTGVIEVLVEIATTITQTLELGGGYVSFSGGGEVTIDTPMQVNEGIISTDASLEITGEYSQTADGALRLFISGNDPGITYSQLQTGGDVSLDGELQIVFRPDDLGYLPEPGDTFDFVTVTGSGTITLDPGLTVVSLVESTQTGAFDEDSVAYNPFDSGLGPVIDPDDLQVLSQNLFSIALAESGTVLRATYTGPDLTDFYDNAPTSIFASADTISEGDGVGTLIATLSATSPIPGGHVFSLVPGDGDTDNPDFSISGNQLLTAALLDFETSSTRSIRIRATNDENRSYEKIFEVRITNVTSDDDDGDNLTEEQEIALGTGTQTADSDGDGVNDGDEVNGWGTNPLDSGDRIRYTGGGISVDGPNVTIGWSSVLGKSYKVEGAESLVPGGWHELPGTINGTGNPVSFQIDTTGSAYRFFRIKPL